MGKELIEITEEQRREWKEKNAAKLEEAARKFARRYAKRLRNINVGWTDEHAAEIDKLLNVIADKPALQISDPEQGERELARVTPSFWHSDFNKLLLGCLKVMESFGEEWANVLTDRGNQASLFGEKLTDKQRAAWANYYDMDADVRRLYFLFAAHNVKFLEEVAQRASAHVAVTDEQRKEIEAIKAAYKWEIEGVIDADANLKRDIEAALPSLKAIDGDAIAEALEILRANEGELKHLKSGSIGGFLARAQQGREEEKTALLRVLAARWLIEQAAAMAEAEQAQAPICCGIKYGENAYQGKTDILLKAFAGEIEPNGEQQIIAQSWKNSIIKTTVTLNTITDNKSAIANIKGLDAWDKSVYNAFCTLCEWNNLIITPSTIYKVLAGDKDARLKRKDGEMPQIYNDIVESIDKMIRYRIIVTTDEKERKSPKRKDLLPQYEGWLINVNVLRNATINGEHVAVAYKINTLPILYEVCKARGHIISFPLDARRILAQIAGKEEGATRKIRGERGMILLEQNLEHRIMDMKHNKNMQHRIAFESVYKELGLESDDKNGRYRARQWTEKILNSFKEKGIIKGYKMDKRARTIDGITILLSR